MSSNNSHADVKPGWLNIARHLQAMTTENKGFAVVTLTVMVRGNEPLFWFRAEPKQVQPMSIAGLEVTAPLLGLLASMANESGD